MKVLLTSTDNPYTTYQGGKHIHLLLLEKGLKNLGIQVTTLYYSKRSSKERIKRYALALLTEKRRNEVKLGWMISYLQSHIPRESFDAIHSHDVLSMLAVHSMQQKKVLTLHGYFARENIEFIRNKRDRDAIYPHLLQLERNGTKSADYVIAVDQRLKDYAISEFSYPADRITVMHNAVDTDTFSPTSEEEQKELKKSLSFAPDDFVVLVPRRLVEKNGVIYAVRAMKNIRDTNFKMIIAGDGPERKNIMKEAQEDKRIQLTGMTPHDKISSFFKMADVILIPSITSHGIQEATSLAMLEGMSCGKVVVCSDIGGMHEVIMDMENGALVKEKEPEAIATAIETIIGNPSLSSRIGGEARKYVLQNHSYTAHAVKVAQIYNDIIGEA
jgi:glycosyltransferase involved in cell wall biosynthesis